MPTGSPDGAVWSEPAVITWRAGSRHDLRTAEIWIGDRQRNERDPRPQTAQCGHHEVHRIADQQGNPIPGLDAFLEQASGHFPAAARNSTPGSARNPGAIRFLY